MATDLIAWRGRNDDGNETTATWKANQGTAWTQSCDVNFRVRFLVQNSTSAINNLDVQLQYNLNGAGWNNVSGTSNVVRSSASPNVADQANLTSQLTGGSGTFEGATAFDEANGICGGNSLDVAATEYFETEFCCQLRDVDVFYGDTIELRTINSDSGAAWTSYTAGVASMTANASRHKVAPGADSLNAFLDTVDFTLTVGSTPRTFTGSSALDNWTDPLIALLALRADLGKPVFDPNAFDPAAFDVGETINRWTDSAEVSTAIPTTPRTFTGSSALDNWTDSLSGFKSLRGALADAWGNLADARAAMLMLLANLAPDDAFNLTDALSAARALFISLNDASDNLADALAGVRSLRAELSDDEANLGDSIELFENLLVRVTDNANNLADVLAGFASLRADLSDDTANLTDALAAFSSGFGELLISLPADSMANAADLLAGFITLGARATDNAANLLDALGSIEGLRADLVDGAANQADSLTGRRAMFADLSDDAANLTDLLSVFESGLAALFANLPPDQMANFADSVSGVRRLFADLAADNAADLTDSLGLFRALLAQLSPDQMGNLADALAIVTSSFVELLVALPADQMGNFVDTVNRIEGLLVNLGSDDAANLADSLAALYGLVVALSDGGTNLGDALAGFQDLYANRTDPYALADALAIFVGGLELIGTVTLSEVRAGGSASLSNAAVGSVTVMEAPADT